MSGWGVRFEGDRATARIWAPGASHVVLVTPDRRHELRPEADGWFAAEPELQPGDRYMFEINGRRLPDPASRAQAEAADGWSCAVRLAPVAPWPGRPWCETVLYELHVGTFSAAGTFLGAIDHLDHLVRLGVTMIELMPVGTFPGARNWGYDGVLPFAPDPTYGTPAELQRLVAECHRRGLSIVLDVVYNHFGPASSFIADYAPAFFTDRHETPWGSAVNFDGAHSAAVRDFFIENALQWVVDYGFDGLRLDAVQAIMDDGPRHILTELAERVRAAAGERPVHLMLENDLNQARWLEGAYDAQWNDDFHHVMRVLLAGQTDGYYEDYATDPIAHLGRALTEGFSYQGQESKHRPGMFRGTKSGHLPPTAFVDFLQNHDQVGNAPYGKRLSALAPAEAVRLGAAVLALTPGIPMLFMGEEWGASTPFDFFVDYEGALADAVRKGRRAEFKRFDAFQTEAALDGLSDPVDPDTMQHSALDWSEPGQAAHADLLALHTHLFAIRRATLLPLLDRLRSAGFDRLGARALEARWTTGTETLAFAANFSDAPVDYAPAGTLVFASGGEAAGRLPAWGCRLTLRPG